MSKLNQVMLIRHGQMLSVIHTGYTAIKTPCNNLFCTNHYNTNIT